MPFQFDIALTSDSQVSNLYSYLNELNALLEE